MTDKDYTWTFSDVRALDSRLAALESQAKQAALDIKDVKEELALKNHVVVDNTNRTDWKAISIIIGATIAAALAAVQQVIK